MQWLWIVLGILLLVIVTGVLYSFFIIRPRSQRQLKASAEYLARQTHGRPPSILVPAQCVTVSHDAHQGMEGLGVLALSDQGVFFAAVHPERMLTIPRTEIVSVDTRTPVSRSRQGRLLHVQWTRQDGQASADFLLADPDEWIGALSADH